MLKTLSFLFFLFGGVLSLSAQTGYYNNLLDQWKNTAGMRGGIWSIPADEQQVLDAQLSYGGTRKQIPVNDQPFEKALELNVPVAGLNAWDAAIFINNTTVINSGDRLLVVMWIRSADNSAAYGSLYIEHSETFNKEAYYSFSIPGNWTQMILPIEAKDNYLPGKLRFGFQVGTKVQKLEFGGFAVRNFEKSYPLSTFPFNLHQHYAGSEANAAWRADAAARIESIHKANLNILVIDSKGRALPGAKVKVKMLQHQFKFGSAITANRIAGNNAYNSKYEEKILNFDGKGHGFNEVVFENDLKWDAWEQHWGASQSEIEHAAYRLNAQKISIRGHNLIWPAWQYMPADMQSNKTSLSFLKNRINNRLTSMLSLPAFKSTISEWDVINEITDNHDLANAFKGSPNYNTGREIYADIMKKVKLLDPNMKTYLNDYVTIDQGNTVGSPKYELCKQYIDEIIKSGGVVEGIGFQAHIGAGLVSIYDVKNTLDDFHKTYGNRAKITEFDISKLVSDSLAGKFTEDFLTMCFSHSYVDGFLSWGFWDGAHWLDNSPYFRTDWSMKPAAKSVSDLLFNQWWTKDTILTTDQNGIASIRGFKGMYQISELCNASKDTIELFSDLKITITSKAPISEF
ncbi:MAG: endo-1,4-beta-xylanase, partial [Saprospiraceae bacterium]